VLLDPKNKNKLAYLSEKKLEKFAPLPRAANSLISLVETKFKKNYLTAGETELSTLIISIMYFSYFAQG